MSVLASIIIRDVIANQPAAGVAGRLFFATDTEVAYYDDGSSWDAITIGSGSVASVALSVPSWLSVAGSPVTSSGTLAVTATSGEPANEFLATPDGTSGAVGLRAIVAGDLPLATTGAFGAVKPDGTTVDVSGGVISVPTSTPSLLGLVKPDGTTITVSSGVITATSGAGTVTSVALTVPADYSVSGSPVTTSGTLAVSENTQSANLVKAGPVSGSAAAPTYRTLEPGDLPAATTGALGAVKPDGATIDVTSGVISVPTATTGALGLVKPDGSTITISGGVITGKSGTITSVALTLPSWLSVAGSPITSSGTLAVTATSGEPANEFLATPDGTSGAVGLRAIVASDLPLATTGAFGAVKPDGTTITVSSGIISAFASPMSDVGDLIIGSFSGAPTRLASGTAGYVLTSNGLTSTPSWQASSGGGGGATVDELSAFVTSPPSSPATGSLFKCTDIGYEFVYTGSAWQAYFLGQPVVLPPNAQGEGTSLAGNGGSITSVATTFNVAASVTATAPFLASINAGEVVKVTSTGSGTDWTVVRGYDSTAATGTDGDGIAVLNWQELSTASGFVSYFTSGRSVKMTSLNFGSGTEYASVIKRLAPATPYTISAAIRVDQVVDEDHLGFGLAFREHSSGKMVSWGVAHETSWQFQAMKMSDPFTSAGDYTITQPSYIPLPYGNILWLQIANDGTNLQFAYSFNSGADWLAVASFASTDYLTADEICFWVNGGGVTSSTVVAELLHFQIVS